jgi:type I restriction enzyme S subunit
MNNLVPEGWALTSIGEVTNTKSLFKDGDWVESKDQDSSGSNRLIQLADIGDGRFINKSSRFMNDEQFTRLRCTELKKGDVLVARMPEPLGRACIYPLSNIKAATIVDIAIIRTQNANHYWLMSAINSSDFRYHIDLNASGTTRTRIARGALAKLKLIAPPLLEQQKIAKILTSVDEVIEKTQAQIDKLKDLKTGMMQELLNNGIGHTEFKDSPVGRIPAEWDTVRIDEVVTKVGSGVTPKGGSKAYVSTGIPLIRSQNVHSDGLRLDNVSFITAEQHQKMKGSQLQANDVLLNITGASIGRCYYLADDFIEGNVNQHVCIIRLKKHMVSHVFITLLLNGQLGQTQIMSLQAGGNREGLNFQQIREIKLPLPPIVEQVKISNTLSSIERKIRIKESKLDAVIKIKKALMQDLLTGKVRVKVDSE